MSVLPKFSFFSKQKAVKRKPVALRYPPFQDFKNARPEDFLGYDQAKSWNHTYGIYSPGDLQRLCQLEPHTNSVIRKLKNDIIRRGYEWKEKFQGYCDKCDKPYTTLPDPIPHPEAEGEDSYICDDCGTELRMPDPKEYALCQEVLDSPVSGHPELSFEDLNSLRWNDLLILGNGFVVAEIEYNTFLGEPITVEELGIKNKVTGFHWVSEKFTKRIMDDYGNLGGKYFVCLKCRHIPAYAPVEEAGKCKECGSTLHPAELIVSPGMRDIGKENRYYIAGEYHWSPFNLDDLLFSFAPAASLGNTIESLFYMSIDHKHMYRDRRVPNQIKWIKTNSTQEQVDEFVQVGRTNYREGQEWWYAGDPEISGPPVGVEKTTYSPKDMDTMEYLERLQNIVAIFYGVMPSERGSMDSGVGLGNQSLELTISSKNIMAYQDRDNEGFYRWVSELFEVKDWLLVHIPPESDDKDKAAERSKAQAEATKSWLEVGVPVKLRVGVEEPEIMTVGQPYTPEEFNENQNVFSESPFGMDEPLEEEPKDDIEANTGGPEENVSDTEE